MRYTYFGRTASKFPVSVWGARARKRSSGLKRPINLMRCKDSIEREPPSCSERDGLCSGR